TRGESFCSSCPFGPLTDTALPARRSTVTPLGTGMGLTPILDMMVPRWYQVVQRHSCAPQSLPDGAEHLAANTTPAGFIPGKNAFRGADDRDTEAALDARDLVLAGVHAQARLADALQLADRVTLVRTVAQLDDQLVLRALLDDAVVLDVALFLQDLRDRYQDLRRGHAGVRLLRHSRVANPGQHVADGIVAAHAMLSPWLPVSGALPRTRLDYQLAFLTPGRRPMLAISRKQMRQTPNFRMS